MNGDWALAAPREALVLADGDPLEAWDGAERRLRRGQRALLRERVAGAIEDPREPERDELATVLVGEVVERRNTLGRQGAPLPALLGDATRDAEVVVGNDDEAVPQETLAPPVLYAGDERVELDVDRRCGLCVRAEAAAITPLERAVNRLVSEDRARALAVCARGVADELRSCGRLIASEAAVDAETASCSRSEPLDGVRDAVAVRLQHRAAAPVACREGQRAEARLDGGHEA